MEKIPMTAAGYAVLETELKHRQQVERPRIIQQITEARSHGDLSENAEYHAAKESQSLNEGAIAELEDKIARAEIIDVSKLSGTAVKFGATVSLADEETDDPADGDQLPLVLAERWPEQALVLDGRQLQHPLFDHLRDIHRLGQVPLGVPHGVRQLSHRFHRRRMLHLREPLGADRHGDDRLRHARLFVDGVRDHLLDHREQPI